MSTSTHEFEIVDLRENRVVERFNDGGLATEECNALNRPYDSDPNELPPFRVRTARETLRDLDGKLVCIEWSVSADGESLTHGSTSGYLRYLDQCDSVAINDVYFDAKLDIEQHDERPNTYKVRLKFEGPSR